MVFAGISFLYYFLPIVTIAYFITKRKYRNFILAISSIFFYFYGEKVYVLILIASIVFNYYYSILIEKRREKKILAIGVIVNLLFLVYFKYTNFIIDNINNIFDLGINIGRVVLPIGISFFTFQGLSYLVDVYRGDVKRANSLLDFATYLSFFPQLIAGPIVRYETIALELNEREENVDEFSQGIERFIKGLVKKVIVANSLGQLVNILSALSEKTVVSYWLEAIAATLQLYFDFSAYSDMAIGMGLFFGFHFLENFDYPLFAKSITDFWRRWHISLSSWFKDYLYIPLGGSRHNQYRNIMIVWMVTGLWHGADWNFVLWGLVFGVALIIEKLFLLKYLRKSKVIGHIFTFVIVVLAFVLFNHSDLNEVLVYFKSMFGLNSLALVNDMTLYYLRSYMVLLIIALMASTPIFKRIDDRLKLNKYYSVLRMILSLVMLVITTAFLLDEGFNPFLYFRF